MTTTTTPGPLPCFLTAARTTLLARLRAAPTLSDAVRTWYDWGPGLARRFEVRPVDCPLVSVVPAELAEEECSNMAGKWPQDIEVGIATDGQDAAPCEELVSAALDVIGVAMRDALGLAGDGLATLKVQSIRWQTLQDEKSARVTWYVTLIVRCYWYRRYRP